MIPSEWVVLEHIPTTIDEPINWDKLLQQHRNNQSPLSQIFNESEKMLQAIWSTILGTIHIREDSNFLELGGDSLKASMMLGQIHKQFGVKIPLKQLFKLMTFKDMVHYLNTSDDWSSSKPFLRISRAEKKQKYEASPAQRRIYLSQYFEGMITQ
jgi:surfactin family lipopeptide synthetase A